mmetsp:Transcript_9502/g.31602  ORF Transcript_9502/g.31602 Transcript_9502/m.31602 type:complete len:219 (-) Transcript_9502:104-760(-)
MRLEQQEDNVALQPILDEGRRVLAQPQRAQPDANILWRPQEDVRRQANLARARALAHRSRCVGRWLTVEIELVIVLVALLHEAAIHLPAPRHGAGRALTPRALLAIGHAEAHVVLPYARALQLEVVRVDVPPLPPALRHLNARHVHFHRTLKRLLLLETLEHQARPGGPSPATLQLKIVRVHVVLRVSAVLHLEAGNETGRAEHRALLNLAVRLEAEP